MCKIKGESRIHMNNVGHSLVVLWRLAGVQQ